ncbi:MAG: hypothetical protein KC503_43205 [Myxococcales bacterium]|nr:hypothetical protein [Myxococcales bacterium]
MLARPLVVALACTLTLASASGCGGEDVGWLEGTTDAGAFRAELGYVASTGRITVEAAPIGPFELRIRYTALSLLAPERVDLSTRIGAEQRRYFDTSVTFSCEGSHTCSNDVVEGIVDTTQVPTVDEPRLRATLSNLLLEDHRTGATVRVISAQLDGTFKTSTIERALEVP